MDNHSVLPRFFAPELSTSDEFPLPDDEAHHLTRVMRLSAGGDVIVFDGRGSQYRATIVSASRDRALVRVLEAIPAPAGPRVPVVIGQAVLKGSSMDDAVRDAAMMGASAIQPLVTEHVDVRLAVIAREANVTRWRRVALASAKQCGRVSLPTIEPPKTLQEWLHAVNAARKVLFVEPSASVTVQRIRDLASADVPEDAAVLLGPEGGWSAAEIEAAAAAGFVAVSLGPLTLRAESMPVAAMAALAALWD